MPFKKENRILSSNWFIDKNVIEVLEKHSRNGMMDGYVLNYIGNTKSLDLIVKAFESSITEPDVSIGRLQARLSCTNSQSAKWHVISIYQNENLQSGEKKQIVQATWCTKSRQDLRLVVCEIQNAFSPLLIENPKYEGSSIKFVGKLHNYRN